MSQPDWTMIYFKDFWALVENGQMYIKAKETELEQILLSFSDFWTLVTPEENMDDGQEQEDSDLESMSESDSGDDGSSDDEFLSLQHFAKMYVLEADQRYLLRTLEINAYILEDQERRLKESKKAVKILKLERSRLAKTKKKMETVRSHKILGSFTQFWISIGRQETKDEELDHLENAGDFFRLIYKSCTHGQPLPSSPSLPLKMD